MPPARLAVAALLAAASLPALALFKVVAPDGSTTYTDRPPSTTNVRVTEIGRDGSAAPAAADPGAPLPFELRQVASRYPVTLYTASDCAPCDSGRQLLLQRGVPHLERRIVTEEDAAALERLVGSRTVPALGVGSQALRGFSSTDWTAYLDAAGYPRESRLPRNWRPLPAQPLVEKATPRVVAAPAPVADAVAPPAPETSAEPDTEPAPGTIRF
ncbi:MAG: glutaredoxin family protein [Rubrivivax sp.]|jgi:glutaredoxin|nr:glutaredoxin family protein [Rubrivivax sp.]